MSKIDFLKYLIIAIMKYFYLSIFYLNDIIKFIFLRLCNNVIDINMLAILILANVKKNLCLSYTFSLHLPITVSDKKNASF